MNDNSITNQKKTSPSKDLDIFQSIDILLKDKFLILFIIIVGSLIGYYYSNNIGFFKKSDPYSVSAKLYPMKLNDSYKLAQINRILKNLNNYVQVRFNNLSMLNQPGTKPVIDSTVDIYGLNTFEFTNQRLFDTVYYFLNSAKIYNQFKNDFAQIGPAKLKVNIVKADPLQYIEVKIIWSATEDQLSDYEDRIEIVKQRLNMYIKESFVLTKQEILDTVNLSLSNYQFARINTIEKLRKQNFSIIDNQKTFIEDRLFHLREQVEIAQEINLDIPNASYDFSSIIETSKNAEFGSINSNLEYNRGFIALNKEIELLMKRNDKKFIIPEFRRNELAIKYLENNDRSDEIKRELIVAGFAGDNGATEVLNLVRYNPNELEISGFTKAVVANRTVFIIFGASLGLIIGIMLSLFKFYYKNREKIYT